MEKKKRTWTLGMPGYVPALQHGAFDVTRFASSWGDHKQISRGPGRWPPFIVVVIVVLKSYESGWFVSRKYSSPGG